VKGLLLKDWYMIKQYCKIYLVISLVFAVSSVMSDENLFFVFYPCVLCGMIPVNLLGYDERSRWDRYSGTLPYTKKQIVSAKYLIGLFTQLAMLVVTGITQGIKMGLSGYFSGGDFAVLMLIMLAMATFSSSITLPFIFKLGVEKGRTAYYVTIGVVCGLSVIASRLFKGPMHMEIRPNGILLVLAFAGICLYILSWYLSIGFYEKREL